MPSNVSLISAAQWVLHLSGQSAVWPLLGLQVRQKSSIPFSGLYCDQPYAKLWRMCELQVRTGSSSAAHM